MQYPTAPTSAFVGTFPSTVKPTAWLPWDLETTFLGRLSEISCDGSGGQRTLATTLVLAMQRNKETVAWLQKEAGELHPPDAAAHGVDLDALVVVQVGSPQAPNDRVAAAEMLLQGGGFGLVVVDVTDGAMPRGWGWQGRLLALARAHHAAVIFLTRKPRHQDSLGAWVSLRLTPRPLAARGLRLGTAFFDLAAEVDKNKGLQLTSSWHLGRRGPEGLL